MSLDNPSNLALVEQALQRLPDVRLLAAMHGRLGLDLAREHRPELILLDLHLPDLGGPEILRRLKSEEATAEIPVAVLSADATKGQVQRLRAAGASSYLTKPIDVEQLLDVVRDAVSSPAEIEGPEAPQPGRSRLADRLRSAQA